MLSSRDALGAVPRKVVWSWPVSWRGRSEPAHPPVLRPTRLVPAVHEPRDRCPRHGWCSEPNRANGRVDPLLYDRLIRKTDVGLVPPDLGIVLDLGPGKVTTPHVRVMPGDRRRVAKVAQSGPPGLSRDPLAGISFTARDHPHQHQERTAPDHGDTFHQGSSARSRCLHSGGGSVYTTIQAGGRHVGQAPPTQRGGRSASEAAQ